MAKAIEIVERKVGEGDSAQTIPVLSLTTANIPALAAMIWASLPGKTVAEKQEQEQKLISLVRDLRNKEMEANKKPRKSEDQVIAESVGKPLADLQTAMVSLGGIRVKIGDVLRLASTENSPLKEAAEKFLENKNLVAYEKKETSKGKARVYLLYRDASRVPENTDPKLIAPASKVKAHEATEGEIAAEESKGEAHAA